jgi:N-acetylmuramic acid 6-phosphate (MurNAc-6-P) etherase
MADWPTVAEVKHALGVDNASHDEMISAALGAAIEQVAVDVGYQEVAVTQDSEPDGPFTLTAAGAWDDEGEWAVGDAAEVIPTFSLSQAALILTVMAVKAPEAPYGIAAAFDLGAVRVASEHPT